MTLSLSDNTYSRLGELIRFGIVGTVAMLIHYGVYYCLSRYVNLNLAFSTGYAISFIFNFFASSLFTFKTKPTLSRFMKFATSHGINYLLQIIIFNFALYLGIRAELAPVMVYTISIPANFLLVRFAMKNKWSAISMAKTKAIFIILTVVSIYGLTIFSSSGYYYPDEHYQLIEFARWKMGTAIPDAIPWELRSEIRPSIQPLITMAILHLTELCGITNPFRQTLIMRFAMAAITTYAIWRFTSGTMATVSPKNRTLYTILSYTLWFIPYLSARYSSETMAAAFLLFGLAIIYDIITNKKQLSHNKTFTIGVLLCLAFEFRYQMAFAIAGIVIWLIFVARIRFGYLKTFALGFTVTLMLCTLCDMAFYGHFTFAPWNYFRENIINGVASSFGTAPWYGYFTMVYESAAPFIGIVILLSAAHAVLSKPKSLVVWVMVCFVAGHMAVAHKELRFLFPLAFILPLLITWLAEWPSNPGLHVPRQLLIFIFLAINTGGLVMMALKPTRYGRGEMLEYLYKTTNVRKMICSENNNIYEVSTLSLDFYRRKGMEIEEDLDRYILGLRPIKNGDVIILNQGDVWRREQAMATGLTEVYRSIPRWMDVLNRFYKTYNPNEVKIAYRQI